MQPVTLGSRKLVINCNAGLTGLLGVAIPCGIVRTVVPVMHFTEVRHPNMDFYKT